MRTCVLLCVLILLIHSRLSLQAQTGDCAKRVALTSSDGTYLKHICEIRQEYSHNLAVNFCAKNGMTLLAINDKEEFDVLDRHLREQSIFAKAPAVWNDQHGIRVNGMRDSQGKWFTYAPGKQPLHDDIPFLNNRREVQEPCLVLKRDNTFKVIGHRCSHRYPIICQYIDVPETTTANPILGQVADLNARLARMQQQFTTVTQQCDADASSYLRQIGEKDGKIDSLSTEVAALRTSVQTHQNAAAQAKAELSGLRAQVDTLTREKADIRNKLNEANLESNQKTLIINNFNASLQTVQTSLEKCQMAVTLSKVEFTTLKAQIDTLTIEKTELGIQLNEANRNNSLQIETINELNRQLQQRSIVPANVEQLEQELSLYIERSKNCNMHMARMQQLLFQFNLDLEANPELANSRLIVFWRLRIMEAAAGYKRTEPIVCAANSDVTQCDVDSMRVSSADESVGEVGRVNSPNFDATKVLRMTITSKVVWFIPQFFCTFFSKLKELSIVDSGLLFLRPSDFSGLRFLTKLNVSHNQLTEISNDVISALGSLAILDLSFNRIERIEHNTFSGHEKLREIRLNNNLITTIKSDIFGTNLRLETVWLQMNRIREISLKFIEKMSDIKYIDLSGNECIDIVYRREMQNNMELLMEKCSVGVTIACTFSDNYKCTAVELAILKEKTKITGTNQEGHLRNKDDDDVTEVIIANSNTPYMPLGLDEVFKNLRSVSVTKSKLSQITKGDFSQIAMLKELFVTHNNIKSIEADSFVGNSQLEKIDLSHNKLTSLPERIFANLASLKSLVLSNNDITELHMNAIDCPASIKYFDFSNNGETTFIQANIVNICLKNAGFIDFSNVFCVNIDDYKIHKGVNGRLHDEMFGVLDVNCKF